MRQLIPGLLASAVALAACAGSTAAPQPSASSAPASTSAKPAASESAAAKPSASGATTATYGDSNGFPIKIAYASPAVASWPFYAAVAAGLYEQQHLKVTMIQAAPNVS